MENIPGKEILKTETLTIRRRNSCAGRFRTRSCGRGEGPNEENKLPSLLLGKTLFEGGHRLPAFTDLVEDFAVGEGGHELCVGEARRGRGVHRGLRAVALSGFAVAFGAFIEIDAARGAECGFRKQNGILHPLSFFRDFPFPVLVDPDTYADADRGEERHEKDFAETKNALRRRGHR